MAFNVFCVCFVFSIICIIINTANITHEPLNNNNNNKERLNAEMDEEYLMQLGKVVHAVFTLGTKDEYICDPLRENQPFAKKEKIFLGIFALFFRIYNRCKFVMDSFSFDLSYGYFLCRFLSSKHCQTGELYI